MNDDDPDVKELLAQQARADEALQDLSDGPGDAAIAWEKRVAEELRIARETMGYPQSVVAMMLKDWGFEMHQTTLAKLEAGKRPLRLAEVFALAAIYGMTPGTVLFRAGSRVDGVDDVDRRFAEAEQATQEAEQLFVDYARATFRTVRARASEQAALANALIGYTKWSRRRGRDGEHPTAP